MPLNDARVIHIKKRGVIAQNGLIHGIIHFFHKILIKMQYKLMETKRTDVLYSYHKNVKKYNNLLKST